MIEGTGVLPNSSSCYIHAENFKLLPHSLGKTTVNLVKTHIALPNIENIVKFSEEGLLQMKDTYPVNLEPLEGIVERVTSRGYTRGIDVSKAMTALRGREVYHQSSNKTLIISCIAMFLGLGFLWFLWFRITGQCCPFKWKRVKSPRSKHMVDEDQELKADNARLQMQYSKGERQVQEAAGDVTPESQTTPTLFSRRGRLEVDHP